jgi:hypothetical protein
MNSAAPAQRVAAGVSLSSLLELAVDAWRLNRWAEGGQGSDNAPARHTARKLTLFLEACGVGIVDLTGRAYDIGLAVEIVDTVLGDVPAATQGIIDEMVSPIITLHGAVARPGQVVLRVGRGS